MTKEETLKLAVEAGFNPEFDDYVYEHADRFVHFAKLVRNDYSYKHAQLWLSRIDGAVEAEREACHALRQTLPNPHETCQVSAHAYDMALVAYGKAIRAREKQ